jgi:stress-induced morphogen
MSVSSELVSEADSESLIAECASTTCSDEDDCGSAPSVATRALKTISYLKTRMEVALKKEADKNFSVGKLQEAKDNYNRAEKLHLAKEDAVPPVKSLDKIEGKPVYNTIMSKLISSPILKPTSITLTDNFNSSQHANHVGSKGWAESGDSHFSLEVVSEAFEGLTLVKRHRMIYALLGETMQKIHSLDIEAKSTSEVHVTGCCSPIPTVYLYHLR